MSEMKFKSTRSTGSGSDRQPGDRDDPVHAAAVIERYQYNWRIE
jgi:hypothetical protein